MARYMSTEDYKKQKQAEREQQASPREITGEKLIEALGASATALQSSNEKREKHLEYIKGLPESWEKSGYEVTRDSYLRDQARTDAMNDLTNGEFKKFLNEVGTLRRKDREQGLTNGEKTQLERAEKSVDRIRKYCNHPEQAQAMRRQQEYFYNRNYTVDGIQKTIDDNKEKIVKYQQLAGDLKGLEKNVFTVDIKDDKKLGNLVKDDKFMKQVKEAVLTKPKQQEQKKARGSRKGKEQGRSM